MPLSTCKQPHYQVAHGAGRENEAQRVGMGSKVGCLNCLGGRGRGATNGRQPGSGWSLSVPAMFIKAAPVRMCGLSFAVSTDGPFFLLPPRGSIVAH